MNRQFMIAGVKHHQMKDVLDELEAGMELTLVPEPTNKFDPNAVKIMYEDVMLGYVPAKFSSEVSANLEVQEVRCKIIRLNKTAAPWEQCLVSIFVPGDKDDILGFNEEDVPF